jgi:hypothetical protein
MPSHQINPQAVFKRSSVYGLLAHAFSEPSAEFLDFIAKGDFLSHMKNATENLSYSDEMQTIELETIQVLAKDGNHELIAFEYEGLTSPQKNFFYECNYYAPSNAMEELADIAGFYRAFGVVPLQ